MSEPRAEYGNGFKKAVKHEAKLRMAIAGPSGSGKTYTALRVGTALANGGKVAFLDTEHGSASKYADIFSFDVMELAAPFHPRRFVEAIKAAEQAGYTVLVLDSLSHAWNGAGGLLDIVDQIAKRTKTANTFAAWKDATPIQNSLVEGLLSADLHVIATMRSKQDYVMDSDNQGRTKVRKVGMAPIQRDGFEYEFDVFLDMDIDNNAIVAKTRCPALAGKVFAKPGEGLAGTLAEWLTGEAYSPEEDPRNPDPEPQPEKPKARRAAIQTDRWPDAMAWITERTDHYSNEWHMLTALLQGGFLVVHDDNLKDAIAFLMKRVEDRHEIQADLLGAE